MLCLFPWFTYVSVILLTKTVEVYFYMTIVHCLFLLKLNRLFFLLSLED